MESKSRLKSALALDFPYHQRSGLASSGEVRPLARGAVKASVLLIFGEGRSGSGDFSLLLTRRTDRVESHKGQMAFPGGRSEPAEVEKSAFLETALRETEEEVGIERGKLEILGKLPSIDILTGYQVEPFVVLHQDPISQIELRVNAAEIAETVWIPWSKLVSGESYRREWIERGPLRFQTHVFYFGDFRIWGATAAMIQNLRERWEAVQAGQPSDPRAL